VRERVFVALKSRVRVHAAQTRPAPHDRGAATVIDADFEEVDPDSVPPRPGARPSGWTQR